MPTERQQKHIYDHSMKNQYIVVTHGKQAMQEYMSYQTQNGQQTDKVRVKDRIGHCTRCHHEFVLPEAWRLPKFWDGREWGTPANQETHKCPVCGGDMRLISGYQGRRNKTIMQYIAFFESSIKDPTVILGKGMLAVRPIEGDYRTCQTLYYPVTLWMFKKGEDFVMYKRDAWYSKDTHQFEPWAPYGPLYGIKAGEDGIGSPWSRQKTLGDRCQIWYNRGYAGYWDKNSFLQTLKKKAFQYCCFSEITKYKTNENIYGWDALCFLRGYCKNPSLEYLVKSGMANIAFNRVYGNGATGICINWRAKDRRKFLKFKLTKLDKQFMRENGPIETKSFNIFALAQKAGQHITLQEADTFRNQSWIQITQGIHLPDIRKLCQYSEKQRKLRKIGIKQWNMEYVIHDYMDYADECRSLGYDLTDKSICWPKDLHKAHQATTRLINLKREEEEKERDEIRRLDVKKRNATYAEKIKKQCKTLAYLRFETDAYCIRPAETPNELIDEGGHNHNCVATYIEDYAMGKTAILFIREKKDPDTPFYTMEVYPDSGHMVQCRTKFNETAKAGTPIKAFIRLYQQTILDPIKNKGVKSA